jgi:hypothetical protein
MLKSATYYRARETAREDAIDGVPLATFSRRAAGFAIDFLLVSILRKPVEFLWDSHVPYEWERHTLINPVHVLDVTVLILYFCLALYVGSGQTLGKRLMRIQAEPDRVPEPAPSNAALQEGVKHPDHTVTTTSDENDG